MADLMIDIEGLATGPDATILTIAAQAFDPLTRGYFEQHYYARITLESQENRRIEQGTVEWWAQQPLAAREEAFDEQDRIPLRQALEELHRLCWRCNRVWMNGPTYDANILEHAYKSHGMPLPWNFYKIRDTRTVYSLCPGLNKYPASHHALEDCRRQIDLLHDSLEYLKVTQLL
jgi:hypothetical protein